MTTKNFIKRAMTALAAIMVVICSVSCSKEEMESTYVGFAEGIYADPSQTLCYEDTEHVSEFDTTACELFTVEQYVEGNLVLYKGETEVDRAPFAHNLNLNAKFEAKPQVVYVSKKENLSKVSMTSSNAGEVQIVADTTKAGFILTATSREYVFNFNEGEEVKANTVYEKLSHKDTLFAYTEIKNVSYKNYDAKLNEVKSNADSIVYDINLYFDVEVECKKNSDVDATYTVRVPVQRIFKEAPAEAVTSIKDTEYKAVFDTTANNLFTVEQYVKGYFVTTLRDKEIGRKPFKYDLNLGAEFTAEPQRVVVDSEAKLTDVVLKSSSSDDEVKTSESKDEFTMTTTSKNYTFKFNENEVVTAETVYQQLSNADTVFAYALVKNVSYKEYDAELNKEQSNDDEIVYDINLYFDVEVECKENSEVNKTYTVRVPLQRVYAEVPVEKTSIKDTEYKAVFDTTANNLFTVEQYVKGYFVTTLRDKEIGRKPFKYDLNLGAEFTAEPQRVVVDSEAKLTDVVLKSSSSDDEVKTSESKDEFTMTTTSKNYTFKFNENEVVTAETVYQQLSNADTVFAYALVKNVSYKEYDAELNKEQSNDDEIVYDINLYFDVEVECKENSEVNKTYTVRVPLQRVYQPEVVEVKLENTGYEGEFDTATKQLFTVKQKVNGDFVTYRNQTEVERNSFERDINLEAIFNAPDVVYVENEAALSNITLAGSSKDGGMLHTTDSEGFTTTARSQNYNFRFNEGENVVSATEFEKEAYGETAFVHSSISNVRYSTFSASRNDVKSNADSTVYDVVLYFNVEVKREEVVETKAVAETKTYSVAVPYTRVLKHEDVMTGKSYRDVKREIISATSERVSFTEYEIWSNSGEKNEREISKVLNFGFSSPSKQTVYTTDTNYATNSNGSVAGSETSSRDGNWTVYTKAYSYSSTADNGHKSFDNKYSYNSQKAVYTNEYYSVEFDYGSWSVSEGNSSVGAKSGDVTTDGIVYDVYPYVNNVNYTYDVVSDSYTGAGKANTDVCIEKPVEKVIPSEWGKIIGAGISAVPADDERGDFAKKCLCIRTDKGAFAVVFSMSATIPSLEAITSAYFVEGEYGAEYNSGFYTTSVNKGNLEVGKWAPAIAKDLKDRIAYYQGSTCKANVRNTTLQMWNWRDGNLSTKVDGYIFTTTEDGTLTVEYKNEVVLRLR